jgi:hypothetical protein
MAQGLDTIAIGGMPEVVKSYIANHDLLGCQQVLDDLMTTYNDDFTKYKKRVPPTRLRDVFSAVMEQDEQKIYLFICLFQLK